MKLPDPFFGYGGHITAELPGAHVLFTTRLGGVSSGPYESLNLGLLTDDAPDDVRENRRKLSAFTGLPPTALAHGHQVHGTSVRRVREAPGADDEPEDADGQATALDRVAPMVLAADCLPIALATTGAVAMVHAGWRGLAGGVIEEGIAALRELAADGPITAAIGPGARPCCYEIGDEVRAALGQSGRTADLPGAATERLAAAGVGPIHDVGLCTMCSDPKMFFSHRRDGGVTGRQAGLIWRA
ncbi:MAG: polyphenol oxidase family protein [Solirubrobacteraceae bacterium]